MDLGSEAYRAVANALTEGQGAFSEEDYEIACLEITDAIVKGQFAALVLEGMLSIKVEDGELKYEASARGKADLGNHLSERGISLEQLKEEMRRGK